MTSGGRRHPSPQELAAIAAAAELLWPRPAPPAAAAPADPTPPWRFSGRWWRRPFPEAQPVVESTRAGSWASGGTWPDPRARRGFPGTRRRR